MSRILSIKRIVFDGVIAALYVILTLPFAQIALGPIQFRISEVLVLLPAFSSYTIPGIAIGCFLANLLNPGCLGPIDIVAGTLATVIAGGLSYLVGRTNRYLGIFPPIIINGLIVGSYLPFLISNKATGISLAAVGISMLSLALSEAFVLVLVGIPFIMIINKTPKLRERIEKL